MSQKVHLHRNVDPSIVLQFQFQRYQGPHESSQPSWRNKFTLVAPDLVWRFLYTGPDPRFQDKTAENSSRVYPLDYRDYVAGYTLPRSPCRRITESSCS
jgi:hypothetical protein